MWMLTTNSSQGQIKVLGTLPSGTDTTEAVERAQKEALASGGIAVQLWRLEGQAVEQRTTIWRQEP